MEKIERGLDRVNVKALGKGGRHGGGDSGQDGVTGDDMTGKCLDGQE